MTYFEFFGLPVSLILDEGELKRQFYAASKKYHPDFFTLDADENQTRMLELSTFNNEAYKTLSHFDRRLEYVLRLKNALAEEGKNEIPQAFLMEMMDVNEALMELEFEPDAEKLAATQSAVEKIENDLQAEIHPIIENYADEKVSQPEIQALREFFFKRKYLLRVKENLSMFARL